MLLVVLVHLTERLVHRGGRGYALLMHREGCNAWCTVHAPYGAVRNLDLVHRGACTLRRGYGPGR